MVEGSHIESLYALIDGIGRKTNSFKQTTEKSIYSYAKEGATDEVIALANRGFNINAREVRGSGRTVLQVAAANGHLNLTKVLVEEYHADIHRRTYLGKDTALHLSVSFNHRHIVFYLLSQGADPNVMNKFGATPLHCVEGKSIAKLLYSFGASTVLKDLGNKTAYDAVLQRGHCKNSELAMYLLTANDGDTKKEIQDEMIAAEEFRRQASIKKQIEKDKEEKESNEILHAKLMKEYSAWRKA